MASNSTTRCNICSNLFDDPRMLPCLHTFCLQCIKKESELQGAKEVLKCPMSNCGENVTLPNKGLGKLPSDQRKVHEAEMALCGEKLESGKQPCDECVRNEGAATSFCVNCCNFLCERCETHHRSARKTLKHEVINVVEKKREKDNCNIQKVFTISPVPCPTHSDEVLKFYCEKCEKLICRDCRDIDHDSHRSECLLVENVAAKEMESLKNCAKDGPNAVTALKSATNKCELAIARVESRKNEVDDAICKSLNSVREVLLARNEEIRMGKTKALQIQIHGLTKLGNDFTHALGLIANAESYTPAQQLATKRAIAERMEELMKRYHNSERIPLESNHFLTSVGEQTIISQMIDLGQITGGSDAVSGTCDIGFIPRAVVGKMRTVKITTRSADGKPFPYGKETVTIKFCTAASSKHPCGKETAPLCKVESNGLCIHGNTTDHGDGTYSASFTPQAAGLYDFHVTIGGHSIKSSPFTLTVREPRTTPFDAISLQKVFSVE